MIASHKNGRNDGSESQEWSRVTRIVATMVASRKNGRDDGRESRKWSRLTRIVVTMFASRKNGCDGGRESREWSRRWSRVARMVATRENCRDDRCESRESSWSRSRLAKMVAAIVASSENARQNCRDVRRKVATSWLCSYSLAMSSIVATLEYFSQHCHVDLDSVRLTFHGIVATRSLKSQQKWTWHCEIQAEARWHRSGKI